MSAISTLWGRGAWKYSKYGSCLLWLFGKGPLKQDGVNGVTSRHSTQYCVMQINKWIKNKKQTVCHTFSTFTMQQLSCISSYMTPSQQANDFHIIAVHQLGNATHQISLSLQ